MDNIIFSANVIVPLLIMMLIGYISKYLGMINEKTLSQCNNMVFKIFLPIMLFNNVYKSSVDNIPSVSLFAFVIIGIILCYSLTTVFVMMIEKSNPKRGAMIQGIARPNYALFGIPLITLLFPNDDISVASVLLAVVIPCLNIGAVVVLTYFGSKNANMKAVFMGILKNPLIIGTFTGIFFMLLNIELPYVVTKSITELEGIATPFSLFLLGSSFEFNKIKNIMKELVISVLAKLVIIPVIALSIAILMGFRGVELGCLMLVFGSPTAVSSYPMAEKMGADAEIASAIVVFTSIFSIVSVFISIFLLRTFEFL